MNLPTLGLILDEVPLDTLFKGQKAVKLVNNVLEDGVTGINGHMTGKQLIRWFKKLDYETQKKLNSLTIYSGDDKEYLIEQILIIRDTDYANRNKDLRTYRLIVSGVSTLFVCISIVTAVMYNVYAMGLGHPLDDTMIDHVIMFLSSLVSAFDKPS